MATPCLHMLEESLGRQEKGSGSQRGHSKAFTVFGWGGEGGKIEYSRPSVPGPAEDAKTPMLKSLMENGLVQANLPILDSTNQPSMEFRFRITAFLVRESPLVAWG